MGDRLVYKKSGTYSLELDGARYDVLLRISPRIVQVLGVGQYDGSVRTFSNGGNHVCGSQGFGHSLNDVCDGCEKQSSDSKVMETLITKLRTEGYLVERKD